MSVSQTKVIKILKKFVKDDMKIILAFSLFIITVWYLYILMMGWISITSGTSYTNTPSISAPNKRGLLDSDGDLLPDIIEIADRGSVVTHPETGQVLGRGTGSNPDKKDSDNDLFSDTAEDNLGSDPTSWISPGYIYLIWLGAIAFFFINRYREPDRLKEYREFESIQKSSVVSTTDMKFAHGGTSIFAGKKVKDMTEEEKRKAIETDARYQTMTGQAPKAKKEIPKWRRRNWNRLATQITISVFVVLAIYFVSQQ